MVMVVVVLAALIRSLPKYIGSALGLTLNLLNSYLEIGKGCA